MNKTDAIIVYWYFFKISKYERYMVLRKNFYSKEEAVERIKNEDK